MSRWATKKAATFNTRRVASQTAVRPGPLALSVLARLRSVSLAVGATAIGAVAIGRLAVGAFTMKRGRVRALTVESLEVLRLQVGELTIARELPR